MNSLAPRTVIDPATVPGWGVDADTRNDPTYPMRDRSKQPVPEAVWQHPEAQDSGIEVLQSIEYNGRPAVYGTGPVPTGTSGMIRRAAFRYSESNWWHWLLLLAADRVNMVEGVASDISQARLPNIPAEMGARAEWEHNRAGLIGKVAVVSAISAIVALSLNTRRKAVHRAVARHNLHERATRSTDGRAATR